MPEQPLNKAYSYYLATQPVEVGQDVIIREIDCGTDRGLVVKELKTGMELIEPLIDRLIGRFSFETIEHPETDEVIVEEDEIITSAIAKEIVDAGIDRKSTRLNSSHVATSYAAFCLKKKKKN